MGKEKERENSNSILPGLLSPISSSANLCDLCGESLLPLLLLRDYDAGTTSNLVSASMPVIEYSAFTV